MFELISVLVPTRKRPARLRRLLDSWAATVGQSNLAELVFRIDTDDAESAAVLEGTSHRVLAGPRLDGYRSLPLFFEELRAVAQGDLLMCGNDDIVFKTPGWPALVLSEATKYPDGVFDLGVKTFNEGHFPFSIVSRRAADAMGALQDPRIYWGDVYLRDVMQVFGRAILMPAVEVDHEWAGRAPDETFLAAGQSERRGHAYWQLHRQCVAEAVAKLRPLWQERPS